MYKKTQKLLRKRLQKSVVSYFLNSTKMSQFLIFTILLSVLGTECFGWQHIFYKSVTKYFNKQSTMKNFLDDQNGVPRETLHCARSCADIFHGNLKSLINPCEKGEKARDELMSGTQIYKTEPDHEDVKILSIRDKDFDKYFIRFLNYLWAIIQAYQWCVPKDRETEVFFEFNRIIEKFTTDLVYHCRITYDHYPGHTYLVEVQKKGDLPYELSRINGYSLGFLSASRTLIMLDFIDGRHKRKSMGCARNSTYMLFAALKSNAPGACLKVTKQIKQYHDMGLTPPDSSEQEESSAEKQVGIHKVRPYQQSSSSPLPNDIIIFITDPEFKSAMNELIAKKLSILDVFESCYREANFSSDLKIRVKQDISMALNYYDLELVNCGIPLEYLQPAAVSAAAVSAATSSAAASSPQPDVESSPQEKYINYHKPTTAAKFFQHNPPLTISCFKKATTNVLKELKQLTEPDCPRGESLLNDIAISIRIRDDDDALIQIDNKDLFETVINELNEKGKSALIAFEQCLKNGRIYTNNKTREEFSAAVLLFQDFYKVCGANFDADFENISNEDEEEPIPIQ